MLRRFTVSVALFFMSICYTISGYSAQNTRVLLIGDSLSAGYGIDLGNSWVDMLSQRLNQQGYDVELINDSISGDTTAAGLARLPSALAQYEPHWVIIGLGANDGLRGLSLKAMQKNLQQMVELSRGYDAKVALIGMDLPKNYGNAFRSAFKTVYENVAKQYDLPLLLGEKFSQIIGNPDYIQQDGLHPNESAQPLIQEIMYVFLQPLLNDDA